MNLIEELVNALTEVYPSREIEVENNDTGDTFIGFAEGAFVVVIVVHDVAKLDVVEIFVRQKSSTKSLLNNLVKINKLNMEYLFITFFVDEYILCARTVCTVSGGKDYIMSRLEACIESASREFSKIK